MIIDGKAIADSIEQEISSKIAGEVFHRRPGLAVVLIGELAPSHAYVKMKKKGCDRVGINSYIYQFDENISEHDLLSTIQDLNGDEKIDGILVQLPLPDHILPHKIFASIDPGKDIDGFNPVNMGKILLGMSDGFCPCTPLGIKLLFEKLSIDLTGKNVTILGRSNIVGKPLAALLMQNSPGLNATVTLAHSKTKDLQAVCHRADVLVAAIGIPQFITREYIKQGAVVIDVGINRVDDPDAKTGYRLVGDVDFHSVFEKCSLITPVPKGVGPMTIASLLLNTWTSFRRRI